MGDVMGPLSYPPWREGETLPPYPPPPNPTPPPARARSRGYSEPEDYGTPPTSRPNPVAFTPRQLLIEAGFLAAILNFRRPL